MLRLLAWFYHVYLPLKGFKNRWCYDHVAKPFTIYIIHLFEILKTIQSRTPYKRGAEFKRIYKIYLQKVSKNKWNLNTTSNIKCIIIKWWYNLPHFMRTSLYFAYFNKSLPLIFNISLSSSLLSFSKVIELIGWGKRIKSLCFINTEWTVEFVVIFLFEVDFYFKQEETLRRLPIVHQSIKGIVSLIYLSSRNHELWWAKMSYNLGLKSWENFSSQQVFLIVGNIHFDGTKQKVGFPPPPPPPPPTINVGPGQTLIHAGFIRVAQHCNKREGGGKREIQEYRIDVLIWCVPVPWSR